MTSALTKVRQELLRLQELEEKQRAKAGTLASELADFEERRGALMLEALNNGSEDPAAVIARTFRDLSDRLDAERSALDAIADALQDATAAVNREMATDHRAEAAKLEKKLETLASKRAGLLAQLCELEDVPAGSLYVQGQGPVPLSVRLRNEADGLTRNAMLLDHGRPALPIAPVPEATPIPA